MGAQVRLRVIHEHLLPGGCVRRDPTTFKGISNSWPAVIGSLKSLLENGAALDFLEMRGCKLEEVDQFTAERGKETSNIQEL